MEGVNEKHARNPRKFKEKGHRLTCKGGGKENRCGFERRSDDTLSDLLLMDNTSRNFAQVRISARRKPKDRGIVEAQLEKKGTGGDLISYALLKKNNTGQRRTEISGLKFQSNSKKNPVVSSKHGCLRNPNKIAIGIRESDPTGVPGGEKKGTFYNDSASTLVRGNRWEGT